MHTARSVQTPSPEPLENTWRQVSPIGRKSAFSWYQAREHQEIPMDYNDAERTSARLLHVEEAASCSRSAEPRRMS